MRSVTITRWFAVLAVFALPALLPRPARAEQKPAAKKVVLDDFEGEVKERWQNLVPSTEQVKAGKQSAKWASKTGKLVDAVNLKLLHDWSKYQDWKLCFWCYSEKATDGRFTIMVCSDDPADDATDFYYEPISVDWTGWKEFRFPLKAMKKWGKPVGFQQVDAITLSFETWWVTGKQPTVPGTVLYFDELTLEP